MSRQYSWLISRNHLRQLLGLLWLADSILLLQPRMLTSGVAAAVLAPETLGQPGIFAANLRAVAHLTALNANLVDVTAATVQVEIGILLISGRWV